MAGVEGVPLYIGGGEASHSAELMRTSNFFHFRGQEGWLTANAGAATEQATPGAGISISPGPFLANSRFPGGALQSYIGRILTGVDVPTTSVPPGDPRSDLVVMNIEDPYPSDGTFWPYPGEEGSDSRRDGPYIHLRVIPGVPSNTLTIDDLPTSRTERGWTCIAIARLDRPANTGTVTAAMIKNLRPIINPWAGIVLPDEILNRLDDLEDALSELGDDVPGIPGQKIPVPAAHIDTVTCTAAAATNTVYNYNTTPKTWPVESERKIIIPPWATRMKFYLEIFDAVHQTAATTNGVDANVGIAMAIRVGYASSNVTGIQLIEPNDVYYGSTSDKRYQRPGIICNPKCAGEVVLDSRDIGKVVTWKSVANTWAGTIPGSYLYNGKLTTVPGFTTLYFNFEFKEG